MELVFVTANAHKAAEVQKVVSTAIKIVSLKDINCNDDIEETATTFQGNALLKAKHVYNKYNKNCFADDSGLEVEALNNEPGVFSARYAGVPKSDEKNTAKLLKNLEGIENRKARFRTVIALILDGKEYLFEGIIEGTIAQQPIGTNGFGYDPVFIPAGYTKTFAQMTAEEKNQISHRAIAVSKMNEFLKAQNKS
ncbi:MAG: non-canonical purine NTP diphosphatase [Bacteroidetes bacterium]|nr:non-canonical purine NTP diphosphatase [Bacteroidota bacterium]